MISRLAAAAAAIVLTAVVLTGCTPPPDPEPQPLFTSEAEAFAAAEKTYRAYVDALNQVDLSDPATFEDVYAWTTGELNSRDRENFSAWHADGYSLDGLASVISVHPRSVLEGENLAVLIDICYDVSEVEVRDRDGQSLVSADRPDVQSLSVTLHQQPSSTTGLMISAIDPAEGAKIC